MGSHSSDVKPYTPALKKRLGQHFLRDTGVIDRIIRWMHPSPEDLFLEIGAGDGALSRSLAVTVDHLIAVELDTDCIARLEAELAPCESATIVSGDILHLDLDSVIVPHIRTQNRLRVAGNLPYNIATAIIEKFLKCRNLPIHDMMFMVQLEVAQRITADPGSKQYGYFSVQCQHHCDVKLGFRISPACFVPRPKVSSAMISLHPRGRVRDPEFETALEMLGKAAFSHRRKTLANSLGRHADLESIVVPLLEKAGIDGTLRAEELNVSNFETLARTYLEMIHKQK